MNNFRWSLLAPSSGPRVVDAMTSLYFFPSYIEGGLSSLGMWYTHRGGSALAGDIVLAELRSYILFFDINTN